MTCRLLPGSGTSGTASRAGAVSQGTVTSFTLRMVSVMPCEWCGTIFCWDQADENPGCRKRHCSEECRKLHEDYRHRMRKLRERCESGEIPRFATRREAWQVAERLKAEVGGRFRAYDRPCPFCGRWHVIRKGKHRGRPKSGRGTRSPCDDGGLLSTATECLTRIGLSLTIMDSRCPGTAKLPVWDRASGPAVAALAPACRARQPATECRPGMLRQRTQIGS